MAQSESEMSEVQQLETFSDIDAELNALENSKQEKTDEFEIGSTVCAISNPSVEGLIVGKWESSAGQSEVIMLVPGYKKKGHAPTFAAIIRKECEKLSKRRVRKYTFPLPNLEKWQACVKKYKKDLSWTTSAIQALNASDREYLNEHNIPSPSNEAVNKSITNTATTNDILANDALTNVHHEETNKKCTSRVQEKPKLFEDIPSCDDSDVSCVQLHTNEKSKGRKRKSTTKRTKAKSERRRKIKRTKHSSSSMSESSSENTDSDDTEVSSTSSSIASYQSKCPFSYKDIRGNAHVRARMKGKSEERKFIRCALHNLYSSYSSLKCVVNDIRARSLAVGTRPLTFDLIWLEQHAIYLDTLMFESFRGVWKQWKEPVVDELALAFLELLVRVSPRREYSDRLDEKVRKWMKKKRIGVSQRYGPVPNYLQQAKITEAGILANNNFMQRRWAVPQPDKQTFNNNNFKSNFRPFVNSQQKQNGGQQNRSSVPTTL